MVFIQLALRKRNSSDCSIRMAYRSIVEAISAIRLIASDETVNGGIYILPIFIMFETACTYFSLFTNIMFFLWKDFHFSEKNYFFCRFVGLWRKQKYIS